MPLAAPALIEPVRFEPVDRELFDEAFLRGWVHYVLHSEEGDKLAEDICSNLITLIGSQYYGERASGIASPPGQVTGMRLGTGTTAVAATGAGAAIVTYVTGSDIAISGGFPTSSNPSGGTRRIQWQSAWAAGVATNAALAEAVITNESPITDVAGTAANTIARVLLSPTINKGASDTLTLTWNHDLG